MTVELLDEEERVISGYAATDDLAVVEDGVAVRVRWRDDRKLRELGDRPVRLRFTLNNARPNAYWCQ